MITGDQRERSDTAATEALEIEPDRPTPWTRRFAYFAGALVSAMLAWLGVEFWNGGNVWSPAPMLMIGPARLLGGEVFGDIDAGPRLVPPLGGAVFLIFASPLVVRPRAVWPMTAFVGTLVAGSVVFFIWSWSDGLKYQGLSYKVSVLAINVAFAAGSVWLARRAKCTRAYRLRYAATLVSCLWFVWCAFPWLGETP